MLRLPRLTQGQKIANDDGTPTPAYQQYIQQFATAIEATVNGIEQALAAAGIALDAAAVAQAAADAANAAAADSAAVAAANAREQSLVTSYVVESGVLSAAVDSGDPTQATITVANHTRKYGDGTSVSVTGDTITGLALSTQYYVFYMDPARAGGAVTYQTTTDLNAAGQTGDRHLVGGYTTPDGAGIGSGGGTTRPPGIPSWKFPDDS